MPIAPETHDLQLDYLLSVEDLLKSAEKVRQARELMVRAASVRERDGAHADEGER